MTAVQIGTMINLRGGFCSANPVPQRNKPGPHGLTPLASKLSQINDGVTRVLRWLSSLSRFSKVSIQPTATLADNTIEQPFTSDGLALLNLCAGAAPGEVEGVVQINAIVPQGIAPGVFPIVVTFGSFVTR
jgi:hypothetical protein